MCEKAIKLASSRSLVYTYKDITIQENLVEFKQKFPDVKYVPIITWHDRYIGGYNQFVEEIENTIINYGDQIL